MISFLRPVMRRKPASSSSPMSPVRNQPSVERLGGGVRVVRGSRANTTGPRTRTSPSSAIRTDSPGQRPTDGADPLRRHRVDRHRRAGLGQAVALEHRDADAAEEVPEPHRRAGRCPTPPRGPARRARPAAAGRPTRRTAHGAAAARGRDRRRRSASLHATAVAAAASKILPLPAVEGPAPRAVVDLLEHPRHGEQDRRPEGAEVVEQVLGVGGVAEHGARLERRALDDLAEHVRERQEQQDRAVDVEQLGQDRRDASAPR